jgi:hypothetical protein
MPGKQSGLSNVQKELLKLYANDVSEETLFEIKRLLAQHFAEKASRAMDNLCDEKNLTEQDMVDWTNEHHRAENRP